MILRDTETEKDSVLTIQCDRSHSGAVANRIGEGIDRLGGLDILVTNSGRPPKIDFEEATLKQFDNVYEMVLRSIVMTINTALPYLKRSNGTITNLIATSAQQPETNHVLANTIRPGIYGLSKPLSREYTTDGIRVNCVCPKKIGPLTPAEKERTTHIDRYADEHGLSYEAAHEEYIGEIIPLGRGSEVDEFGKTVAFISSAVASYITGHSLNVDGGWSRNLF